MSLRDWAIIISLGAIWGCSFLFNAVLLREMGPLWVSAGRVGIAAVASWVFLAAIGRQVPRFGRLWLELGLLGVFTYALPFALFPIGQAYLASGVVAIINAMTPIMTVVISHFWAGGERAGPAKFLGVGAGFAGALVLSLPALAEGGTSQLWAVAVCLLATLCYAVSLNLSRRYKAVDPTSFATIALTGATLAAVPIAFFAEGVPVVTKVETWGAWLAIGLVSTFFTFQVMYRILPRVGATNFSATTFIAPISAIILGSLLLSEQLRTEHLTGMLLIFTGLLLIDGRLVRRFRRAPA